MFDGLEYCLIFGLVLSHSDSDSSNVWSIATSLSDNDNWGTDRLSPAKGRGRFENRARSKGSKILEILNIYLARNMLEAPLGLSLALTHDTS